MSSLPIKKDEDYGLILALTLKQGQVLNEALDFFSRMIMGQVEEVSNFYRWRSSFPGNASYHEDIEPLLKEVKRLLFPDLQGTNYGINNAKISDDARIAFDIRQVIRNKLALHKNPTGGNGVDYETPKQTSHTEKIPTAIVKKR